MYAVIPNRHPIRVIVAGLASLWLLLSVPVSVALAGAGRPDSLISGLASLAVCLDDSATNAPVPHARVWVKPDTFAAEGWFAWTDSTGWARFPEVASGGLQVSVCSEYYGEGSALTRAMATGIDTVRFRLWYLGLGRERRCEVSLEFDDFNGVEPFDRFSQTSHAAGATLVVKVVEPSAPSIWARLKHEGSPLAHAGGWLEGTGRHFMTDQDGVAVLKALQPGRLVVHVSAMGWNSPRPDTVVLRPGEVRTLRHVMGRR
jgi:hypothetical protein